MYDSVIRKHDIFATAFFVPDVYFVANTQAGDYFAGFLYAFFVIVDDGNSRSRFLVEQNRGKRAYPAAYAKDVVVLCDVCKVNLFADYAMVVFAGEFVDKACFYRLAFDFAGDIC